MVESVAGHPEVKRTAAKSAIRRVPERIGTLEPSAHGGVKPLGPTLRGLVAGRTEMHLHRLPVDPLPLASCNDEAAVEAFELGLSQFVRRNRHVAIVAQIYI